MPVAASLLMRLAPLLCMKGVSASSSLTAWVTLPAAASATQRLPKSRGHSPLQCNTVWGDAAASASTQMLRQHAHVNVPSLRCCAQSKYTQPRIAAASSVVRAVRLLSLLGCLAYQMRRGCQLLNARHH